MKTITAFKNIFHFETEHLSAYKLERDDIDKLRAIHTTPDVALKLNGILPEEKIRVIHDACIHTWEVNNFGLWTFYLKSTNEWVGLGGLKRSIIEGQEEVDVAYALMPKFWGQGLATEIAKASVEIAFDVLRLDKIVCFTLPTSHASQRVMQKVGFEYKKNIIHAEKFHVLYQLKNIRQIKVVPYDKKWADYFAVEAEQLKIILGEKLKVIHHIGSTAIPEMYAKPVVDIILEFDDLDAMPQITKELNALNYYNIHRHIIPHRSFFTCKNDKHITFHLYLRERGDPQIKRHINFINYLKHHPADAKAYAQLKIALAEKFYDDRHSYVFGKDKFIQAIDSKVKIWKNRRYDFLPQNTGTNVKSWSQEKIIKALEANLNMHMTYYPRFIEQIDLVCRVPKFTLVNSGLPDDTFNCILDAGFLDNEAKESISKVIQHFTKKNLPFSWWVCPYDKPANLGEYLEGAGLKNTDNCVGMYLDLDAWKEQPSVAIEIAKACNQKTFSDFANILFVQDAAANAQYFSWIANAYTEDDPIEFYTGYVNGKPVTRGLIVFFAQVAGIYQVATVKEERRKGMLLPSNNFF